MSLNCYQLETAKLKAIATAPTIAAKPVSDDRPHNQISIKAAKLDLDPRRVLEFYTDELLEST